jgi:hypothetical protein
LTFFDKLEMKESILTFPDISVFIANEKSTKLNNANGKSSKVQWLCYILANGRGSAVNRALDGSIYPA